MKNRILIYIVLAITVLFSSAVYGIMSNQESYNSLDLSFINEDSFISPIDDITRVEINSEAKFIMQVSGLSSEVVESMLVQCREKKLDPFIVLGLMKVESNYNRMLVGSQGERGLGQLMDSTARTLARNLDIEYKPELLFKPQYNIQLFTTHLSYLFEVYDGNVHKALTAYNRGEYGLQKYIASRSTKRNPAASVYSNRVIEYANFYKKKYYTNNDEVN